MLRTLLTACLALLPTLAQAAPDFESDAYIGWSFVPVEKDSEFIEVRGYTHRQSWLRVPFWNRFDVVRTWRKDVRQATDGQMCWWEQEYSDATYEYLASLRLRLTHVWHLDTTLADYYQAVGQVVPNGAQAGGLAAGAFGAVAWAGRTAASNAVTGSFAIGPAAAGAGAASAGATLALGTGAIVAAYGLTTALVRQLGASEYVWQKEQWVVDDIQFDQIRAAYDDWWMMTYELDGRLKSPLQWASSGTLRASTSGWAQVGDAYPCDAPTRFVREAGSIEVETWFSHEVAPAKTVTRVHEDAERQLASTNVAAIGE